MDVFYTLDLTEYRFLNVPTVKQETAAPKKESGLKERPNTKPAPKTYTVVSGDCLWNIAKKFYGDGSQYTKLYKAATPGRAANGGAAAPVSRRL